jgi:heme exporter protein C
MWFGMMIILLVSVIYSIKYLNKSNPDDDIIADEAAKTGIMLGLFGLFTGMFWAKFTWGAWWTNDPKLNGAAATLLVYFAYFLLRNSIDEEQKRGRIAAVYSIFAFVLMIVFIMILPRMTDSLHPGNGGNPGFNNYDLDNNMRIVFYPAVSGWTLLAVWILNIRVRLKKLINKNLDY